MNQIFTPGTLVQITDDDSGLQVWESLRDNTILKNPPRGSILFVLQWFEMEGFLFLQVVHKTSTMWCISKTKMSPMHNIAFGEHI